MALEKVIWNGDKTVFFVASQFNSAHIRYPNMPADKGRHRIWVNLRGSYEAGGKLVFESCPDLKTAKAALQKLAQQVTTRFNNTDIFIE